MKVTQVWLTFNHKDDIAGVPFLFLTPSRRVISRPSSRASTHSFRLSGRPETPTGNSAPGSPSLLNPRRPHTPAAMSPLAVTGGAGTIVGQSPGSSPIIAHAPTPASLFHTNAQFATSLPASPLGSPRLLSAKAMDRVGRNITRRRGS